MAGAMAVVALALTGAPADADQSSSAVYQADSGHTGRLWGAGVVPPLQFAWTVSLGQAYYSSLYPVISNGIGYAVDHSDGQLVAVSLSSGGVLWRTQMRFDNASGDDPFLAVDNGKVFAVGNEIYPAGSDQVNEAVEAYDAGTGAPLWDAHPTGDSPSQPVVSGGVLYVDTTDDGGNRAAIDESNGEVLWDVNNGSTSLAATYNGGPVTLAGQDLVGFDTCGGGVGSDASTGSISWLDFGSCTVASGMLGTLAGGDVWFGDPDTGVPGDIGGGAGNAVVNPATGQTAGHFPGGSSPIFADGIAFQRREVVTGQSTAGTTIGGDIVAFDPSSGQTLWTFQGTNDSHDIMTLPLAADGYVFAASANGRLWALDPQTGQIAWSGQPPTSTTVWPNMGLAAGDGYIIVLGSDSLSAFKGSGSPVGGAPSSWTEQPSPPASGSSSTGSSSGSSSPSGPASSSSSTASSPVANPTPPSPGSGSPTTTINLASARPLTAQTLRALLMQQLSTQAVKRWVRSLLKGGVTVTIALPGRGNVTIRCSARPLSTRSAHHVMLASARSSVARAERRRIVLHLTSAGRRMHGKVAEATLVVTVALAALDSRPVTATRSVP